MISPYRDSERSRSAAEAIEVIFEDDTLAITAPKDTGKWFRGDNSVKVEVHAPIDSSTRIDVASAQVNCRGRYSQVEVNSASGDIKIDEVTGDTTIDTASGKAQVMRIGGELTAFTASGDITVTDIEGPARIKTASGKTIISHTGGDVDFGSASGKLQVESAHRGTISVNTASRSASVGVDSGTGVWLDLNSMSGSINSDLGTTGDAPDSHDLTIQIRTASGGIDILRAKQKAAAYRLI